MGAFHLCFDLERSMDIKEIEQKYDEFLIKEGITGMFDITDELCANVYFKYVYPTTKLAYIDTSDNKLRKLLSTQLNYTRLSLLRVKYMRNGYKSKGIKEGFVYLITNPAWPDMMKIGSSIDVKSRLNSYQTYSPKRDYKLVRYYFSRDRFYEEGLYHKMMPSKNEWCHGDMNAISGLFASKRLHDISVLGEYVTFGL